MPEHGRFWEFPLIFHPPHLLRLLSLHKNSNVVSHLHLTQTACRSPQIKHSRVSQAASEVTFERVGSRLCPSVWPPVNFLFKYLPRGNESPPTAFLTSFFFSSSGLCPQGSDEDTSFSPGNCGIYTSQKEPTHEGLFPLGRVLLTDEARLEKTEWDCFNKNEIPCIQSAENSVHKMLLNMQINLDNVMCWQKKQVDIPSEYRRSYRG